jgi:hypothetical protein
MTPPTQSTNLENTARHRQGYALGWFLVVFAIINMMRAAITEDPAIIVPVVAVWGLVGSAAALRRAWGWYVLVVSSALGSVAFLILGVGGIAARVQEGFLFVVLTPVALAWFVYFYDRRVLFGVNTRWRWVEYTVAKLVGQGEAFSDRDVIPSSRQPPVSQLYVCIAITLGFFIALCTPVAVASQEFSYHFVLLLITVAYILAFCFARRGERLPIALSSPLFLLFMAGSFGMVRPGYVSVSAPSPDGRVVAEVYERKRWIDYNFDVRLKAKWLGVIPTSRRVFRSPDEGPPEAERLLWSKDGRYLLHLGTRFFGRREEARLASGEYLYLLVDTEQDIVYTNAGVRDARHFSVDDLSSIAFGESFTPLSQ